MSAKEQGLVTSVSLRLHHQSMGTCCFCDAVVEQDYHKAATSGLMQMYAKLSLNLEKHYYWQLYTASYHVSG